MLHVARSLGVGLHASRAANVLWQTESLRRRGGLTASSRPWPQQQLCAYSSKSGWGDDDPPWTGSALVDSLLMCAWITCAVHTFDQYGFSSIWVQGPSMEPTFMAEGDMVTTVPILPDWVPWSSGPVKPGDCVIAYKPSSETNRFLIVKRVLAMEGQRVRVFADDKLEGECKMRIVEVPKGHVWLQGDNPSKSLDSRNYGPVPLSLVTRRAWYRFHFPRAQLGGAWSTWWVIPRVNAVDNSKILDEQQQYIVKD